ncbi:alkaline phosphatase family protein [Deinococcus sp. AJ005]|uniref:alkaline phosphatase family protein n=1 Tax=Deinococcus sp. AJ005 TaxID=2652443 RepID=UPI00125CC228|nr:alkaline phosphatase family protein [Deinococcus sp. AJ005]QFP76071.1 phosphoesterase [Deinococcus sp. AJ005]
MRSQLAGLMAVVLMSSATAAPAPFSHVFVIVMENTGYKEAIGNPNLPTLNALAQKYSLATNYTGVAHPSLPNYVALLFGSTFGSHNDDPRQSFKSDNLALQLESAGLSWKGYFQGLPSVGWDGGAAGHYGKKHNPFMLSADIAANPKLRQNVVKLDALSADLNSGKAPNFALIVPDVCHDMHGALNCPRGPALQRTGNAFIKTWTEKIMASSAWTGRSAIVITFDESEGGDKTGGGGKLATVVITKNGPRNVTSAQPYNHYSLLRTLEDGWGLPALREAGQARPMTDLFGP